MLQDPVAGFNAASAISATIDAGLYIKFSSVHVTIGQFLFQILNARFRN